MSTANSRQVAGNHYQAGNFQHWDIVDTWGVGYLEGCCTKYLSRFRKKNGLQDLQKADHYLQKLIEVRSTQPGLHNNSVPRSEVTRFLAENGIIGLETAIIHIVFEWAQLAQLKTARHLLEALIAEYEGSNPGPGYVNQDQ